jgi:hypothetical protein
LATKNEILKLAEFSIKNCVYLLWSHLDYSMLRGITSSLQLNGFASMANDMTSEVQNIVSVFNENFSKQLLSTQGTHSSN